MGDHYVLYLFYIFSLFLAIYHNVENTPFLFYITTSLFAALVGNDLSLTGLPLSLEVDVFGNSK